MIVKPLYITCAHAVSPNSEMLGLMNANSLILFQFGHLIWFKATTAPNVGSQGENHWAQQKKTQIAASLAFAVPPTAPLFYYRVIKHSFLSQASSLITQ